MIQISNSHQVFQVKLEGEKNDHGGPPLLETMEGGGETNQGGSSNQPMDRMDVGENSQGGNSGEPMEGGHLSGPTEVGGQKDQQSSLDQAKGLEDSNENNQAKRLQDSNENKSLIMTVISEAGGVFYEADDSTRQSDRRGTNCPFASVQV
jgi:hypothetical protein